MDDLEDFRTIWNGDDETDCVELCRDLQKVGIVYRVTQQAVSRSMGMGVNWHFRLSVPQSDYERARRELGLDAGKDEIEGQAFEIQESPISQSDPDEAARAASYLKRLDHNDATEEVWSQGLSDNSSIVELALKENLIRYHIQRSETGIRKFLVLLKDKPRALEILRQIKSGDPPAKM